MYGHGVGAADDQMFLFAAALETSNARFYFIDAGEHCVKLSNDAESASGIVVGLFSED
ncbi:MAG: hypothetical protein WAO76_02500 [Georgfuchsia sp.]